MFPQVPLFKKRYIFPFICWFLHRTICHHKGFTGRVLLWENFISPRDNLFHTQRRFLLARYRSPNGPYLLRMVQPIRSRENPGTTMVSIGHLTPWPENPGYRTQVWDKNGLPHRRQEYNPWHQTALGEPVGNPEILQQVIHSWEWKLGSYKGGPWQQV